MTTCEFHFVNPNATFEAGETVQVQAELVADERLKVRRIYYVVKGIGKSEFIYPTDRRNDNYPPNTIYEGTKKYLEITNYLRGSEYSTDRFVLAKGRHVFNIACHLPTDIPPSFSNQHGSIAYTLTLVLHPVENENNHRFVTSLQVIKNYYFLNFPATSPMVPIEMEELSTYYCWLCKTKPMRITIKIPKNGFSVGENVPIDMEINNQSGIAIQGFQLRLYKLIVVYSQKPVVRGKVEVLEIFSDNFQRSVLEIEIKRFRFELEIPRGNASLDFRLNGIVNISYVIQVIAIPIRCHIPKIIRIPIIIALPNPPPDISRIVQETSISSHFNVVNSDIMPPSFEEAMTGIRVVNLTQELPSYSSISYSPSCPTAEDLTTELLSNPS